MSQPEIISEIRQSLDNMTVTPIKQIAKQIGIKNYSAMKKIDVMDAILKIFGGYSIDKLTIISNICKTSNNIGEDIIKCLLQEQTQLQATTKVTPSTSTTANSVHNGSGSQLMDSDISILNNSMTGLTIRDTVGMGLQSHASGTAIPLNSRPLEVGLELSVDGTSTTEEIKPDIPTVKNRGNGAGGANTNINGLSYETKTDLVTEYTIYRALQEQLEDVPTTQQQTYNKYTSIKFNCNGKLFIKANKGELYKIMMDIKELNTELEPAAGCKNPDEAYLTLTTKRLYVIEKKFQQTSGSVDEKIQTGVFKKYHYEQLFPNFTVSYIYCLSDWFKKPEYKSVIQYLKDNQIQIFWGAEANYKQQIIDYMCSAQA